MFPWTWRNTTHELSTTRSDGRHHTLLLGPALETKVYWTRGSACRRVPLEGSEEVSLSSEGRCLFSELV